MSKPEKVYQLYINFKGGKALEIPAEHAEQMQRGPEPGHRPIVKVYKDGSGFKFSGEEKETRDIGVIK